MKKETTEIVKRIQDYALEEIMGVRFGAYAKEIIQDRAIPDVRDGLKPVQRRILYDMYKNNNDSNHAFMKCAKTVGDVLGKFHPHGDSSVYEAMVRMSQWWKQSHPLIDIHGNNGSMDGDGPAAYRYTEARLSKISDELLRDLDKNTVTWAPNFDDTLLEPTVLPAKFPNLLVNGTNGISAGYATNIPPHNLGEIIDATIKRIDSPNCRLETILEIVKGPDFPTGGIACGKQGIIDAFTTGRGRVIVKSKYEFVKDHGKEQIIISEIPFDVNKALLVQKIDAIRIDKKLDGMAEVRDESDRDGLRIAIDLKPNANKDVIINYLLKNTELQISYNYNMVAIVNRRPMTLGIIPLLDAYINHQKEVITKRSEYDLATYKARLNIVDGFLKMMSILDKVIKVIRASKNKTDAKDNLIKEFVFNSEQAEAIVMLQLYKLTNTDVVALEEEQENLKKYISALELILSDEEKLKDVMKHELKNIKQEYAVPRKTVIENEIQDIKIDDKDLITKERVVVVLTHDGYIKKTSLKSYQASNGEEPTIKPGDYVTDILEVSTLDNILIFTNLGQYLFVPVHIIFDAKWKELGKHVNNLIGGLAPEEKIVATIVLSNPNNEVIMFTKNGLVKRTQLKDFIVSRYSKAMTSFKLKDDDEVINVLPTKEYALMISEKGKYLTYSTKEISMVGPKAAGVKGMSLTDDKVISAMTYNNSDEYVTIITNNKTAKRIKLTELELLSRAKKGSNIMKKVKSFDYKILTSFLTNSRDNIVLNVDGDLKLIKSSDIPIMDLLSTGSTITKAPIINAFVPASYKCIETTDNVEEEPLLEEENDIQPEIKQTSLDDFYQDFKL
jgi:topoisomerase IV subunit A